MCKNKARENVADKRFSGQPVSSTPLLLQAFADIKKQIQLYSPWYGLAEPV